jgi:phosphatidylglycerophosphatase A
MPQDTGMTQQLSLSFILGHPARFIAFGFGAGLAPVAPGTFGTLVAIPLAYLLRHALSDAAYLLLLPLWFALGVWACVRTGRELGVHDYGGIVWDEVVAFMLVLFFVPATWLAQAVAFALFRFFDIVKPPPIRQVDAHCHGGFGVMADDILAAFYALLVLALWQRVWG